MPNDLLFVWRQRIFSFVFISMLIAAMIPYFLNLKIAWASGQILNIVVISGAYLIAIVVTFLKAIPFRLRAWIGLLLIFLMGVLSLTTIGPVASGRIWLFMFAVLATLILGLRAGVIALIMNVIMMLVWIWAWQKGFFSWHYITGIRLNEVMATSISFVFLNAVVTISLGMFVRALERGFEKEQSLSNDLRKSNKELFQENQERKKVEEALRNSEQNYRLVVDNVNDIIWTLDIRQQRLIYVSPSVEKMMGFTPEEFKQLTLQAMLSPASYQKVMDIFKDKRFGGDPGQTSSVTLDLELIRQDGSPIWTEVTASYVTSKQDLSPTILGIARDITERRQAQEVLQESEERIARSKKMESLGLLAGGVAHDLNNILSGIISYPQLLLMDLPENSKLRKPIETIEESGNRAAAIVQDLLTIARGVAITKEPLNLNDLITTYLNSPEAIELKHTFPDVRITARFDTDLFSIRGSDVHIRKLVMNLVSNAVEAVDGSGNVILATKNCYVDRPIKGYDNVTIGEYVVLEISDNGPGISSDDLKRVFEPFYSKKVMGRSGTGLGLAVVWNIVLDHRGYIDVVTNNKGTKFEVYLPITREVISAQHHLMPIDALKGNGEKILIIDDEQNQREIASVMLDKLGYQVESVANGEAAVEYLKQHDADLLMLDMIMDPGMNGRETYQKIIMNNPDQNAIIVSGFAVTEDVKAAQKLGAGEYVKKPYSIQKIGLAIQGALKQ